MILSESEEAEKSVLSCILNYGASTFGQYAFRADHFSHPIRAELFAACKTMYDAAEQIDVVTVTHRMKGLGRLIQVGGVDALHGMALFPAFPVQIEHHAEILEECRLRRAAQKAGIELARDAPDPTIPIDDTIKGVARALAASSTLLDSAQTQGAIKRVTMRIREKQQGVTHGLSTGFRSIDKLLSLNPGRLVVLGAHPGVGKTSLVEDIMLYQMGQGVPGLIFQNDMPVDDFVARLACKRAQVLFSRYDQEHCSPHEEEMILDALHELSSHESLLRIHRPMSLNQQSVRRLVDKEVRERGIKYVVLDVFQRWKVYTDRVNSYVDGSNALRDMSIHFGIPFLILAHLTEDDKGKRIRYCEQLVKDADNVVMMHSHEEVPEAGLLDEMKLIRQKVVLSCVKGRGSGTGDETLFFDKPRMTFHETTR